MKDNIIPVSQVEIIDELTATAIMLSNDRNNTFVYKDHRVNKDVSISLFFTIAERPSEIFQQNIMNESINKYSQEYSYFYLKSQTKSNFYTIRPNHTINIVTNVPMNFVNDFNTFAFAKKNKK